MKAILSFTLLFATALAEPPVYRTQKPQRQFFFAQQQQDTKPTAPAAAPYPPSGWRPDGPAFELPQRPAEDSYGPPKDQQSAETQPEPQPQQQYGAPDSQQQYGAPDSQQQYRAPQPQQQYRAPQPQRQYLRPLLHPQPHLQVPQLKQQYRVPELQQQYGAPEPAQQYGAPEPEQQYGAPGNQPSYSVSEPNQDYGAPEAQQQDKAQEPEQQYGAPEPEKQNEESETQRGYDAREPNQDYKVPEAQQLYGTPEPEQEYGVPLSTTTELPTTTDAEEPTTTFTPQIDSQAEPVDTVNELDDEGDVDEPQQQQETGEYYVALPDGRLQRIQYVSRHNVEAMKYFARISAENVEPLRGPIFAYSPLQQLQFLPTKLQVAPLVAPVVQAAPTKLEVEPVAAADSGVPAKLELQPSDVADPVAAQVQYQYGAPAVMPLARASATTTYTTFAANYQVPAPESRYILNFQ